MLRELAQDADLVILDAPPLLPVADAQVLLDHPQVDGCLVVARAYQTTRDEARRARAILERHGLERVGLVVNGVRELDGRLRLLRHERPQRRGRPARLTPSA